MDFDPETALFGVFDGHGGAEVAKYTAAHLPEFLKNIKAYQSKNFENALKEAFVDFDKTLINEPVRKQLKILANSDGESEPEDDDAEDGDETNVKSLREEAKMPLQELLTRYAKERLGKSKERKAKLQAQQSIAEELEKDDQKTETVSSSSETNQSTDSQPTSSNGSNGEPAQKSSVQVADPTTSTSDDLDSNANGESTGNDDAVPGPSSSSSLVPTSSKDVEQVAEEEAGSSSSAGKRKSAKPAKRDDLSDQDSKSSLLELLIKDFDSEDDDDDDSVSDSDDDDDKEDDDEDDNDEDDEEEEDDDMEDEDDSDDDEDDEAESENDENMEGGLAHQLLKVGNDVPGKDSGCTAVMALLHNNELYVANAGDSRCVLSRAGKAIEMSFDHKPESDIEYKRIRKAGGSVSSEGRVNGGLNLSRAIGDHSYKENHELDMREQMITALPDIERIELTDDDQFMVIACDGIWNSLTSQEVVDFVNKRITRDSKLSDICDQLFHRCLAGNTQGDGTGCDNMTCVIVRFDEKIKLQNGNGLPEAHSELNNTSTITTNQSEPSNNKRSIEETCNGELEESDAKTAKKVCNRE